jgi:curved DNA-binding protein CbpA
MEEINKCYKILKVRQGDSFRKIRKSYNTLMLKYHPSRPLGRFNRDYFREIVLAYDLLSKLNKYSLDFSKSSKEIYNEWVDLDMAFAIEKVDQYSKMKFKDFEKEFLPGCFNSSKAIAYLAFFILAIAAVAYPISAYKNGQIPGLFLFYLSVGYTIPLFVVVYRTIVDEKYITRRFWDRCKLEFYLFYLRTRKKPSSIEYGKNETQPNSDSHQLTE